jgi:anti-sigma B factor antagonist
MGSASVPPSTPFFDARRQYGDTPAVHVVGEVDLSTRDQLAEILNEALSPGCDLLVDCTQIRFIDASGISVLLAAARAVGEGHLRLTGVHGALARIVDILDLAHAQPNLIVEKRPPFLADGTIT